MAQTIYEHKQLGLALLILVGIPLLILFPIVMMPLGLFVITVLLAVMIIFSSLTVRVDREHVTLIFGPGVFNRAFPVRHIREARVVRNPLWYGLGIHLIPNGVVYNVSGLGGVELVMRNGRRAVIGSDEPEELAQAVEDAMMRE